MKIGNVILTDKNNFNQLEKHIVQKKYTKVAIVCDQNTKKNCLPIVLNNCKVLTKALIIETKGGENNKNISQCIKIVEQLQKHNFDKKSLLISIGGGLLSDIGGFTASIYKRGIDTINIPTTLLSMVDASVGGKNGVNVNDTKNLIGTIIQPKLVYINTNFIKSQSNRQVVNGISEMIKIAIISDSVFFNKLKSYIAIEKFTDISTIHHAVKLKNDVVLKDPFEKELRKCLNFGHTIGHAIESSYINANKDILHGEAVSAGMIMETYIALKLGLCEEKTYNEIKNLINNYYTPIKLNKKIENQILKFVEHDKKNIGDKITIVVPTVIGRFKIIELKNSKIITEAISYYKLNIK